MNLATSVTPSSSLPFLHCDCPTWADLTRLWTPDLVLYSPRCVRRCVPEWITSHRLNDPGGPAMGSSIFVSGFINFGDVGDGGANDHSPWRRHSRTNAYLVPSMGSSEELS